MDILTFMSAARVMHLPVLVMVGTRTREATRVALALLLLACSSLALAGNGTNHAVMVTLRPAAPDRAGMIHSVDVTVVLPVSTDKAGAPLLRMPLVKDNVKTSATLLQNFVAQDAEGDLALKHDDDVGDGERYRHWVAARPVHGPVTVSYRVPITNKPNPLGAAPPYELRSEGRTFSGLLATFVPLPEEGEAHALALHWDFSAFEGEPVGVSTLGLGNSRTTGVLAASQLGMVYVMGGFPGRVPEDPGEDGFIAVWQGDPPFAAKPLLEWTHRLYAHDRAFFESTKPHYSVFLRANPVNPGGGVEVANSFVVTFGPQTDPEQLKLTLSHEMVHTFVGSLDSDAPLAELWFSEGLAVYYQGLLPLRAGLISRATYLEDRNVTAARYYTDKLKTTPNRDIPGQFWVDTRVRVLPYDRGALYFAGLNATIRTASDGKRSLDDLLLAFLGRRDEGKPLTRQAWVRLVTRKVGKPAKRAFTDLMQGKPVVLDSGTFGPCFRRVSVPMQRYQLGFNPEVLVEPQRIVRGLIADSAAAKAGLRNGDRILQPVAQDAVQADQDATLTLQVRRGDRSFDVTYLPRGESVGAWQWVATDAPSCH